MRPDQARELLSTALLRIVPDADLAGLDDDEDFRDALELDSLDFLSLVETLSQQSGVPLDEDDYPRLTTTRSTVDLLATRG
ncbi:MAG TPA: phosphopantetheine-binding protein [Jiangellales bacterium]|nr:phosphopantetheine-binding protein [Jiangellales bacterium]